MLKRSPARCAGIAGLALLAAAGCAGTQAASDSAHAHQSHAAGSASSARFVHCVFFTFKPGVTEAQIAEFVRDCHALKAIPAVRRLDAGHRDKRMMRDVNVTDYEIGLVVYFDDKAGHDAYSVHPVHDTLISKHKDKWEKVRVYDFDGRQ